VMKRFLRGLVVLAPLLALGQKAGADAIYWTENDLFQPLGRGQILRANLDGTGKELLVSGLKPDPGVGLALDVQGGKMYWVSADTSNPGDIRRANLDGSGQEVLIHGTSFF